MALKTVLDTLDGVDDAIKPYYTEVDGVFVLQVDGVDNHPEVANLRNAYAAEKQKRQQLGQELATARERLKSVPDDFDPEKWKNAGKADPQELVNLRKTLEAERDEWREKFTSLETRTRQDAIREAVQKALADQNVPEGARRGAALDMMDGKKVEMTDGRPMIETDMGPMPIADYAKRWVASEGRGYIPDPKGGGSKGNGGSTATITREQFEAMGDADRTDLFRKDPETFKRLSAA